MSINKPSSTEIDLYLNKWDSLDKYVLQESALSKLFHKTYPLNKELDDILIKVCSLNDFYSTNIFEPFAVAKRIHALNIDERLKNGDSTLVNDISVVVINGKVKNFYSFATKYCSHHYPNDFPIYDSYVEKMLIFFMKEYSFSKFNKIDLRDFSKFKKVLLDFQKFFNIENYTLKQIDQYLWLLGKEKFPNEY